MDIIEQELIQNAMDVYVTYFNFGDKVIPGTIIESFQSNLQFVEDVYRASL